jgi:hypothetical protein
LDKSQNIDRTSTACGSYRKGCVPYEERVEERGKLECQTRLTRRLGETEVEKGEEDDADDSHNSYSNCLAVSNTGLYFTLLLIELLIGGVIISS